MTLTEGTVEDGVAESIGRLAELDAGRDRDMALQGMLHSRLHGQNPQFETVQTDGGFKAAEGEECVSVAHGLYFYETIQ